MSWLSDLKWSNRLEHLYAMIAGDAELDETVPSTYDRKQGFLYKIAQRASSVQGVAPEQFGAKGDGVTDDTAAIQKAVDSGKNVAFAPGKTYRCGTITVTKNITIDCAWSEFVCTGETLFNCAGKVDESVVGADYVAGRAYALPDGDTYTGYAVLRSLDNVITLREYYYGGFTTLFTDGVCNDCHPISFTGVTVDKITPIICKIRNVGNVEFDAVRPKNRVVKCVYGLHCEFDGFDVGEADYYSIVSLQKCYGCRIANVCGFITYHGTVENYYPLNNNDSSYCLVEDCDLTSDWWSAFDIGGNLLCFGNKTKNCRLHAVSAVAYGEHANAIGSIIEDCEIDNMDVGAGATLSRIRINQRRTVKDSQNTDCRILLKPNNISGINNWNVSDIEFNYRDDADAPPLRYLGIRLTAQGYTTGNHYYVDDVNISHVTAVGYKNKNLASLMVLAFSPYSTAGDYTVNGNITLDDVIGRFYIHETNIYPNIIFGGQTKTVIKNCDKRLADNTPALQLGGSSNNRYPPDVEIRDSVVTLTGIFDTLRLFNVVGKDPYYNIGGKATLLFADNIGRLRNNAANMVANYPNAIVTNMHYSATQLWTYLNIQNGVGNYGLLGANGVVDTALS